MSFPVVSEELVRALEKLFPDRCPTLTMTDRDVWYQAGSAHVVNFLRKQLDDQSKNVLKEQR